MTNIYEMYKIEHNKRKRLERKVKLLNNEVKELNNNIEELNNKLSNTNLDSPVKEQDK